MRLFQRQCETEELGDEFATSDAATTVGRVIGRRGQNGAARCGYSVEEPSLLNQSFNESDAWAAA